MHGKAAPCKALSSIFAGLSQRIHVRKPLVRISGILLFLVFLAGIMPKEYIHHALFDHEDGVHPIYGKDEVVITKKHEHCSFLSFEFAPFVTTEPQRIVFTVPPVYYGYQASFYSYHYTATYSTIAGRGPPASILA